MKMTFLEKLFDWEWRFWCRMGLHKWKWKLRDDTGKLTGGFICQNCRKEK